MNLYSSVSIVNRSWYGQQLNRGVPLESIDLPLQQGIRKIIEPKQPPIRYDTIYMIYDMILYDMIHYMIYDMIRYMIWYDTWYDMTWYMIWYDIWYKIYDMIYDMIYMIRYIWYDIWYMIYDIIWHDMIYLLIEIGLSPGGSSTVHIYKQTIHRTTQKFRKSAGRAASWQIICFRGVKAARAWI